jgi:hypothetical protein
VGLEKNKKNRLEWSLPTVSRGFLPLPVRIIVALERVFVKLFDWFECDAFALSRLVGERINILLVKLTNEDEERNESEQY